MRLALLVALELAVLWWLWHRALARNVRRLRAARGGGLMCAACGARFADDQRS